MKKETKEKLFDSRKFKSLSDSAREKTLKFISILEERVNGLDDDSWYRLLEIYRLSKSEIIIDHSLLEIYCHVCFLHAKDFYVHKDWKTLEVFSTKALMISKVEHEMAREINYKFDVEKEQKETEEKLFLDDNDITDIITKKPEKDKVAYCIEKMKYHEKTLDFSKLNNIGEVDRFLDIAMENIDALINLENREEKISIEEINKHKERIVELARVLKERLSDEFVPVQSDNNNDDVSSSE